MKRSLQVLTDHEDQRPGPYEERIAGFALFQVRRVPRLYAKANLAALVGWRTDTVMYSVAPGEARFFSPFSRKTWSGLL